MHATARTIRAPQHDMHTVERCTLGRSIRLTHDALSPQSKRSTALRVPSAFFYVAHSDSPRATAQHTDHGMAQALHSHLPPSPTPPCFFRVRQLHLGLENVFLHAWACVTGACAGETVIRFFTTVRTRTCTMSYLCGRHTEMGSQGDLM